MNVYLQLILAVKFFQSGFANEELNHMLSKEHLVANESFTLIIWTVLICGVTMLYLIKCKYSLIVDLISIFSLLSMITYVYIQIQASSSTNNKRKLIVSMGLYTASMMLVVLDTFTSIYPMSYFYIPFCQSCISIQTI